MQFDELAASLENALKSTEPENLEGRRLAITVGLVLAGGYAPSPTVAPLISCIDNTPVLRELFGLQLFLPVTGLIPGAFDHSSIAYWLIKTAKESSVGQAIRDLDHFLEANEVPMRLVSSIEGMRLSRKCLLGNATYLIPWSELTDTPAKGRIYQSAMDQHRSLTAAVVHDVVTPKLILSPDQVADAPPLQLKADDSDIVMCASLFGPCGADIVSTWWEVPSWVPAQGFSFVSLGNEGKREETDWPDSAYDSFPRFYENFVRLGDKAKARFRVPLHRLNSAMRRWDQVDSAIDSGIALESLFRSGNSHKLLSRAARYLDSELETRKRIRKNLGLVHDARNDAVHRGVLQPAIGSKSVDELLDEGFRLIAKVTIRMIETGEPVWEDFDLS